MASNKYSGTRKNDLTITESHTDRNVTLICGAIRKAIHAILPLMKLKQAYNALGELWAYVLRL